MQQHFLVVITHSIFGTLLARFLHAKLQEKRCLLEAVYIAIKVNAYCRLVV